VAAVEIPYNPVIWTAANAYLPGFNPPPSLTSPAGAFANGDFAVPVISAGAQYQPIPAGSTAIAGWTVGGGGVEAYAPLFMQPPPNAKTEIRLFDSGPGSISQTVSTIPGDRYLLTWEGAGEPGGGQTDKVMHVFWEGNLVASRTYSTAGRSLSNVGWTASQLVLTASSPASTVEFADATPDKSFWASMVGDVSLKQLSS